MRSQPGILVSENRMNAVDNDKIMKEDRNSIAPGNPAGTVLVESRGNPEELREKLDTLLDPSQNTGDTTEVWVVCGKESHLRVESFVRNGYPAIPVLQFPGKPGQEPGAGLSMLKKVRTPKIAYLPETAGPCIPQWETIAPEGLTALGTTVQYPRNTARVQQRKAGGWACTTGTAMDLLKSTASPEEWSLAQLVNKDIHPLRCRSFSFPTPSGGTFEGESGPEITTRSKVLAVIPHYKCEPWLARCLESMVRQTRPPDAVVVVDDGSNQPPLDIVKQFPAVTLLRTRENVGPYRIIQQVIQETAFDAYLFQDADDWSPLDRLQLLLEGAERSRAQLIGSQEMRVMCTSGAPHHIQPVCYPLDVNRALEEKAGHALLHPTSLVSRNLVMRAGGFATGLRFGGDTEFLYRAATLGRVVNIPAFGYFRRHRDHSLTTGPSSGLGSPARLELQAQLKEMYRENKQRRLKGLPPRSEPLRKAPPVALDHVYGPSVMTHTHGPKVDAYHVRRSPIRLKPAVPAFSELRIENTNLCGFQCFICPRERMTRDKGIMPVRHLELVMERVGNFSGRVDLHGFGEPLLDPGLTQKIALVSHRRPQAYVRIFSTLGLKMEPDTWHNLLAAGLDHLEISMYGWDPGSYRAIHGKDRFALAMENLDRLCRARTKGNYKTRLVMRKFPVHRQVKPADARKREEDIRSFYKTVEAMGVTIAPDRELHNYGNGRSFNPGNGRGCSISWGYRRRILQVTWDLRVVPCCFDFDATVTWGNLRDRSLAEIFGGEAYRTFIDAHMNQQLGGYPVCSACDGCRKG